MKKLSHNILESANVGVCKLVNHVALNSKQVCFFLMFGEIEMPKELKEIKMMKAQYDVF